MSVTKTKTDKYKFVILARIINFRALLTSPTFLVMFVGQERVRDHYQAYVAEVSVSKKTS
jgi:hypothetical protein